MNAANRPYRRHRTWSLRHPTRRDGVFALVLLLLPSVAAIYLYYRRADIAAVTVWVAIALGLPVIWLAWATYRETRISGSSGAGLSLAHIADELAIAVRAQWDAEVVVRRLNDPWPLPVSWVAADAPLNDSWDALLNLAATGVGWPPPPPPGVWGSSLDDLAGKGGEVIQVLAKVPTGRLVVLGEPGAGKTMLMVRLVVDLLKGRANGDPVPVLASLASWNADEQGLHEWLASQLIIDHPGLMARVPFGGGTRIEALFAAGLIVPVLDGLDEIPDALRSRAASQIIDSLRPGERLVITCRTQQYRMIVQQTNEPGAALRSAAALQLLALDADTVSRYLLDDAGGPRAAARWTPVLDALGTSAAASADADHRDPVAVTFTEKHPSPIAEVLTTPLMVSLTRTIYNPRSWEDVAAISQHPSDLVDAELFPSCEAIKEYLIDSFISASYRRHPETKRRSWRNRWSPEQAQRWLTSLAEIQECRQSGSTDIEWWKLPTAVPKYLPGSTLGVVVGAAFALGYPFRGLGIGLVVGIIVGIAARRWIWTWKEGLVPGIAGGAIGGVLGGFAAQMLRGHVLVNPAQNLVGGLAVGIAMSLMMRLVASLLAGFASEMAVAFYQDHPAFEGAREAIGSGYHFLNALGGGLTALLFVELVDRSIPARGIRWSPRAPAWFFAGVICSVATGVIAWVEVGALAGLAVGLAGIAVIGLVAGVAESVATDPTGAASPATVLRRDRTAFLTSWLGLGIVLGSVHGLAQSLTPGHPEGFWYGTEIGAATFVAVGLVFGFIQSMWGPFTVARSYLAASGRVPWRLMRFLDDAHRKGVLRQVGAVYQFRHVELQRRLATKVVKR